MAAGVDVLERAFALDLVTRHRRRRRPPGRRRHRRHARPRRAPSSRSALVTARAVVLATGGYGQIFASTSNPPAVTGDGSAIALRAGLTVRDVEFVQFHPTVMWRGPDATGQQPLGQRGGARRGRDPVRRRRRAGDGRRPPARGPRPATSSPRRSAGAWPRRPAGVDDHVYLDATNLGERFYDPLPVDHRGVPGDRHRPGPRPHPGRPGGPLRVRRCARPASTARRPLPGLFAVGEVACTGVHGANRLASNSLTEGVVAGTRLGRDLAGRCPTGSTPVLDDDAGRRCSTPRTAATCAPRCRATSACVRDAASLAAATTCSTTVAGKVAGDGTPSRRAWEATNVLTVAVGRRRRGDGPHGEPRLPPPRATSPSRATSGDATSTSGSAPTAPSQVRPDGRSVPPAVRGHPHRLLAAGLDPDAVAALVRMAVAEDLMGGIDVTSVATVPADQRSVGHVRQPRSRCASPASPSPPR